MPWTKVEIAWGRHVPAPAVDLRLRRQPDDARDDARRACGGLRRHRQGEGDRGSDARRSPESYRVADGHVSNGNRSMTLASVARRAIELGGTYDGHELPENINEFTTRSATALAGRGSWAGPRHVWSGRQELLVRGRLRRGRGGRRDRSLPRDRLRGGRRLGTIIHPRSYGGQLLGRSVLGMGHTLAQKTVYDQKYGLSLATRMYQSRPPTILDVPRNMKWDAVNLPDPETPVALAASASHRWRPERARC